MKNFSMGGQPLTDLEVQRIDPRIRAKMYGWTLDHTYNGKHVTLPGSFGSILYPFQYAEIFKTNDDLHNPGEAESEKQLYMGLGWPGCDFEVIIALRLTGTAVLSPNGKVTAEVIKAGGAGDCVVRHKGRFITDFKQYGLWGRFFKMEKAFVGVVFP